MADAMGLATQVMNVVGPVLPYLLGTAGGKATEEIGKRLGGETLDQAKALWGRLWPRMRGSTAEKAALTAAANVEDSDARSTLRFHIRTRLEEDPAFAVEVTQLLGSCGQSADSVTTAIASGEGAVAAGRDISGTVITGEKAGSRRRPTRR
jgi:hypothetical protein